ncbi:MAG: O-antigen ligase family protein [Myxococcales bacterium]|nr:O-antigen ligase family protein [Myxococcales bacterium]
MSLRSRTERLLRERDRDLDGSEEPGPRDRESTLELVLELCVAAAVLGSVMALGAVHVPVMAVVGCVATLGLGVAIRLGARAHFRPALVFGALALYSALQAIPLPMGILRAIAPSNADVWSRALLPFGAELTAAPVSLDPGASLVEALRWYSYGALFIAAATIAARRGPRWGMSLVFGSALAAAAATVGHGLLGMTKVFGIYQPAFKPMAWHLGPLLNPNNLSGYLNLGAFCGLALLADSKDPMPRWMVAAGIVILFGVNATTGSRAGLAVLILGLVALTIALFISRRSRGSGGDAWRRVGLVAGLALAMGIGLAVLSGARRMWAELYDQSLVKLDLLNWVRPVVVDHPVFGVGRGAFESVFPAYQPTDGSLVYTHAENFIAQWLAEWGIVATVLALGAFAWFFRPGKLRLSRSGPATAAWVGVVVLALQNLLDLGLEVPGVCIAAAAVTGSVWGNARRGEPESGRRASRKRRRLAWAAVAAGTALVGGTAYAGWHDLGSDRVRLQRAVLADEPPRSDGRLSELRLQLRKAMLRHPSEAYFALLGATLATQERDEAAMPWLQRALERSRLNGRAHLLAAHTLAEAGQRSQALLELRLAVESETRLIDGAVELIARLATTPDELLSAVPDGILGAAVLDSLAAELGTGERRALGEFCDGQALERNPKRAGPHTRLAAGVISRIAAGRCEDITACRAAVEAHAVALADIDPRSSAAAQLRASLLIAEGHPDDAESLLATGCEGVTDLAPCLQLRASAAAKSSSPERLQVAAKALLSASCMRSDRCAEAATWLGDLHGSRGEWGTAVTHYERATREAPNDERFLKLADAASSAGLHSQATQLYERLLRHRDDPELRRKLERARSAAFPRP